MGGVLDPMGGCEPSRRREAVEEVSSAVGEVAAPARPGIRKLRFSAVGGDSARLYIFSPPNSNPN